MADFPATTIDSPLVGYTSAVTTDGLIPQAPCAVVVTYYALAAYDSSSRRYWTSTTIDFASAPAPVGSWNTATLTVLSSWT